MVEEYKTFRCDVVNCVECCTHANLGIPVTLPDLYRACVYAKVKEDRDLSIPEAFDEFCDGWMYFPDPEDLDWSIPVPKSKVPCTNLDTVYQRCSVHDSKQYTVCRSYPEAMLIESNVPGMEGDAQTEEFWKSLHCMQGVSLTHEREEELKDLCDLSFREIRITGSLLNNRMQPVMGRTQIEREIQLRARLEFFKEAQYLQGLIENMCTNRLQERYMEAFNITDIDYTMNLVPNGTVSATNSAATLAMIRGNAARSTSVAASELRSTKSKGTTYRRSTEKVGRNDSCPCGSGLKHKKCCGAH
ncbi:MAG: SEC-C metal-binding domain-containing protein [Candidatus Aenigmatarchaeota archaeon]